MSIVSRQPIYTEINNCRDCYKCVRTCPVKAIQIKDAHALILHDRCTFCGTCVNECPNGVKQIRNDVDRVQMAFMSKRRVIVSLAPSYVSEFQGLEDNFVRALYKLGFDAVSETAIGAALVSQALDMYIIEHGHANFISTACPSVVELVKKYFPECVDELAPVPSPLQTHSAYLRHLYGDDIVVVFIGPCIAKKLEADEHPGYPDIALTFREVEQWLEEDNIQLEDIDTGIPVEFIPAKAGKAAIYPIENGQIETSKIWQNKFVEQGALSVSGIERIMSSLRGTHTDDFLETLNCDGGCINGPGTTKIDSAVIRKKSVASHVMTRLSEPNVFDGDAAFAREVLRKGYGILNAESPQPVRIAGFDYTEEEIKGALLKLGKTTPADELNCGGCGYQTCRDMAKAMLAGLSETEMCVTKMRKDAESKVDMLLSTIPNGVVIVDNELNIADLNKRFVDIFDESAEVVGRVQTGNVMVDGLGVGDVGNIVLRDRQHLAEDGIIIVVMTLESGSGQVLAGPDIVTRGFVYVRNSESLIDEAKALLDRTMDYCMDNHIQDWGKIKTEVKEVLGDFVWKETKRRPMIMPIIMEV